MLYDDDVERICESAIEVGLTLTEDDARAVWKAYCNKIGDTQAELPVSFNELMDIVQNTAKEMGVGVKCNLVR